MNNFDDLLNYTPETTDPVNNESTLSKEEWAEKKQVERDAVFEMADKTAMKVASDGVGFTQYLDTQATFIRYSAVNVLLIMAKKPEATRLGDFDYWKNKKGFVKKNENAISILEPGKEYERKDGSGIGVSFNVKKVFDISQIDDRKLKFQSTANYEQRQVLAALVETSPVTIVGVENLPVNVGAMKFDDRIDVRKGMGFDDTFSSLTRELMLFNLEKQGVPLEKAEFTAYCASYVLCKKYGADTKDFDFSNASEMFTGLKEQDIKQELSAIRDSANDISMKVSKVIEQSKTAKEQER